MLHKASIKFVFALGMVCSPLLAQLAHANPVMDLRFDGLLAKANELKKELNLNANQQVLWQQTENKLQAMRRQRDIRRERMQVELEQRLEQNNVELRELTPQIEQEEQTTEQENKQMRELVLTINDALDDKQRQMLQMFLLSSLRATQDPDKMKRPESGGDSKQKGGMGRQRGGSMGGGMGGGGMGGGMGGGG
ncbi:hypothetical protein [Undibacterium sp. Ji49W]|uniref:hypothetical protein n=1 Tax=Undibacterium sp. Ji49W TaxID=3413040 RepID=UPI003BF24EBF